MKLRMQFSNFSLSDLPDQNNVLVIASKEADRNTIVEKVLAAHPERHSNCIQFDDNDAQDRIDDLKVFVEAHKGQPKTVVFNNVLNRRVLRDTGLLTAPSSHLANIIVSIFDFPILYPIEKNTFTTLFIRTTEEKWAEIFNYYFKHSFEWADKKYCEAAQLYCSQHDNGYIVLSFSSPRESPKVYCYDALPSANESVLTTIWRWLTWQ